MRTLYWKPTILGSTTRINMAAMFRTCTLDLRHLQSRRTKLLLGRLTETWLYIRLERKNGQWMDGWMDGCIEIKL